MLFRWDDWVPQDRLRKFTEENHELARNLKKEMDAQRRAAPKPASTSTRRRPFGSDLNPASSTRGSEERGSIATAPPPPSRGTKRGREYEGIDKVCDFQLRVIYYVLLQKTVKTQAMSTYQASQVYILELYD